MRLESEVVNVPQLEPQPKFTLKPAKIHRPGDNADTTSNVEIKKNDIKEIEKERAEPQNLDPNESDSDSKLESKDGYLDPNANSDDEMDPNADSDEEIDPNEESEDKADSQSQNKQAIEPIVENNAQTQFERKRQQIEKIKQMVAQYQAIADDLVESGKVDKLTEFDNFDDIVKETIR